MHVSLSEVQTTMVKAAVAVGLPLGLGEDAGRAARHMMACGVGSIAAFADALDAVGAGRSTGFDANRAIAGDFGPKPAGLRLSAIRAGPSACDLVAAAARTDIGLSRIALTDVDVPIVVLFQALAASADMAHGPCVTWNAGDGVLEAVCWRGALVLIQGAPEDLRATGPGDIAMHSVARQPRGSAITVDPRLRRDGVEIDAATWRRVATYADRLLVAATETSRLTGAGAGVVDTD